MIKILVVIDTPSLFIKQYVLLTKKNKLRFIKVDLNNSIIYKQNIIREFIGKKNTIHHTNLQVNSLSFLDTWNNIECKVLHIDFNNHYLIEYVYNNLTCFKTIKANEIGKRYI